jgi:hypothetical protein
MGWWTEDIRSSKRIVNKVFNYVEGERVASNAHMDTARVIREVQNTVLAPLIRSPPMIIAPTKPNIDRRKANFKIVIMTYSSVRQ